MDSSFTPVIWPEDKAPAAALAYEQCEVCSEKSRIIWGEGNPQAPIVVILDNPGAREDKEGQAFVCGTRQTLQAAIDQVKLTAKDVYLTYLLKCRPLRRYNKEAARAFSKPFLLGQLETIKPKFIVCLGDTVVKTLFDDDEAQVKNLRGKWHSVLGFPAIVSYHPLAVRRRPNLRPHFLEDWEMLARRFFKPDEEGM